MKKGKTVSKHDIIRDIKDINAKIEQLRVGLETVMLNFRDYVEFRKKDKKYMKYLEKKYEVKDGK